MSNQLQRAQETYGPQTYKTFEGALGAFLSSECPQLGGPRSRQVLVHSISSLVASHFPKTANMAQGQIRWTAVHKNETSSYGKTIAQSKLTPVILDLLPISEITARAEGTSLRDIKKEAISRLFTQAYEQDGVLTNVEVALLLKMSPSTVGNYRREWEKDNARLLPTRGSIHDMGPTLTHKDEILRKLIFEGKSVEQVCMETDHSPEAVLRYTTNFKQVLLCERKGFDVTQTSFATKLSHRLIEEHRKLISDYRRDYPNFIEHELDQLVKKLDSFQKPSKATPTEPKPTQPTQNPIP
jgi:hypothetical protein